MSLRASVEARQQAERQLKASEEGTYCALFANMAEAALVSGS